MKFTRKEIIKIASKKAIELGYNINEMNIVFDNNNSEWEDYKSSLMNGSVGRHTASVIRKIENKDFQSVYYTPKDNRRGGDLWVFVDRNNGGVIDVIRGM